MMDEHLDVFEPYPLERYALCHPVDRSQYETIIQLINGIPRAATWQPIEMRIIHEDGGRKLRDSDSPWLGEHALMFTSRAIDALGHLLDEYGENLPLRCENSAISIYNPTNVLNALDEDASSITRFSNGQIMRVSQYVFRRDVLVGSEIFKIPNLRASPTFVGNRFVQTWNSANLKGLGFKKVWSG